MLVLLALLKVGPPLPNRYGLVEPFWNWLTLWKAVLPVPAAMLVLFAMLLVTTGMPPVEKSPARAGAAREARTATESRGRRSMGGVLLSFSAGARCPGVIMGGD